MLGHSLPIFKSEEKVRLFYKVAVSSILPPGVYILFIIFTYNYFNFSKIGSDFSFLILCISSLIFLHFSLGSVGKDFFEHFKEQNFYFTNIYILFSYFSFYFTDFYIIFPILNSMYFNSNHYLLLPACFEFRLFFSCLVYWDRKLGYIKRK